MKFPFLRHKEESAPTLELLCARVQSYFPEAPVEDLRKAYRLADAAHATQKRASGDPYIIHPLEVALILAGMRLDISSVICGLLHDTVEDTTITLEQITSEFGKPVSELVDGVTKLSKLTFRTTEEKQAENFRKMILAMAKDIRVILVKLADRLNNMRTLDALPEAKQKTISQETLDIYAPIANRLGMSELKIELEDLCLKHLHPETYAKLADLVATSRKEREAYIEQVTDMLNEKLRDYDMQAQVSGRAKHFYSIYKKMERRGSDFNQVNDLIAFRIVVENITECYKALGVIHAIYKPIPGRFKDYIAMPKANSYQSLHTTVMGPEGDCIEIQIRTQEMHQVAERGIAAHWKYKEGRFDTHVTENVDWVNRLLEWHKELTDPNEFLETVKIDLFAEDVFVFTPKGEVKQLPYGSSPIDFAYAIHTNVGNHCVGAKVNSRMVPLKHRLSSGDIVEVLTSPTQSPSKDWLKIARSSRARAKIRVFIKTQERDKARESGQALLEKELKKYGSTVARMEKSGDLLRVAQAHHFRTPDELYMAIGYGQREVGHVVLEVLPKEILDQKLDPNLAVKEEEEGLLKRMIRAASRKSDARNIITVANLDDILIRFAKCCHPLPGDSIIGFITRGRGVTIHTGNCPKALDSATERRVEVKWNLKDRENIRRVVRIRIFSHDSPGLLATMSQAISGCNVNIVSANIRTTKDKKAIALVDVEVTDISQLGKVQSALESLKAVIAVERTRT